MSTCQHPQLPVEGSQTPAKGHQNAANKGTLRVSDLRGLGDLRHLGVEGRTLALLPGAQAFEEDPKS